MIACLAVFVRLARPHGLALRNRCPVSRGKETCWPSQSRSGLPSEANVKVVLNALLRVQGLPLNDHKRISLGLSKREGRCFIWLWTTCFLTTPRIPALATAVARKRSRVGKERTQRRGPTRWGEARQRQGLFSLTFERSEPGGKRVHS